MMSWPDRMAFSICGITVVSYPTIPWKSARFSASAVIRFERSSCFTVRLL
jgi:hypothetical protein